ncbi:HdeD family acid-resistance protein [Flavivirga sp. 57AJ16]|uniref:HdeD family acid-resistance protein n=1 Tax=Flavivirga sp. 57AJ16 TaxID=3025307 RepID=UPI0023660252|nr:DUF308 domain-containing protein [Flavivirga sp. 57AJ16]MDD7886772.1 DUF308 domain-containing protein [Flavivirga sp. 57AJ16]
MAKPTAKNWWLFLVLGVLFIVLGIWMYRTPEASYVSLALIFSISIFISGVFSIIFSLSNRKKMESWGWHLVGGLFDLILGTLLILHPQLTIIILPFYMGFWTLFRGIFAIGLSFQFKAVGRPGQFWLLLVGFLAVIIASLLLLKPIPKI